MAHFRYLCIPGTGGRYHYWAHDLHSSFNLELARLGGEPILMSDNRSLYSWDGRLQGTFWTGEEEWYRQADIVEGILKRVPLEDRIVFCHSHGGQIAIILARRLQLRTLTTISTPHRPNLKPEEAVKNIGFWQHVFDPDKDWIGTAKRHAARFGLGGIGGGGALFERRFLIPGVLNVGIPDARHSEVFSTKMKEMIDAGVFHRAFQLGLDDAHA